MTARNLEAALALHRFGFGPVAGSIAAIADDPRGALLADLERPSASTRRLLSAPITSGTDGCRWVDAAAAILRSAGWWGGNR
jgi:uncharacterized protein (DUF1800 family)